MMGCRVGRGINRLIPHSHLLALYPSLLQSAALDGQQMDGTVMPDLQTHLIDGKTLQYIYMDSPWEPVTSSHQPSIRLALVS